MPTLAVFQLYHDMNKFYILDTCKILRNKRYSSITTEHAPGFPTPYVMVFYKFNGLKREMIVRFVVIGGIVNHHCLEFFSVIQYSSILICKSKIIIAYVLHFNCYLSDKY